MFTWLHQTSALLKARVANSDQQESFYVHDDLKGFNLPCFLFCGAAASQLANSHYFPTSVYLLQCIETACQRAWDLSRQQWSLQCQVSQIWGDVHAHTCLEPCSQFHNFKQPATSAGNGAGPIATRGRKAGPLKRLLFWHGQGDQ